MTVLDRRVELDSRPDLPAFSVQRLVLPSALLILGFIAVATALLIHTARQENQVALNAGRHIATSALTAVSDEIATFTRDYAYWDEAVENIIINYDPVWADDNIGQWAIDGLLMDGSIIFGDRNRVIHQAFRTHPDRDIDPQALSPDLINLLGMARKQGDLTASGPEPATGFFRDADGVYLAAASVIVTELDNPAQLDNGSYAVLLLYRTLDNAMLAELESRFLLDQLSVTLEGAEESQLLLPLYSVTGSAVAGLTWNSEQPGTNMLKAMMAPAAIVSLFVMLLFAVLLRRARRATLLVHDYHNGMQAQTTDLMEARDSAEAANRSKSHFLAMMSHELRTPLNAVIGFSDVIRLDQDGTMPRPRIQEYANDIHSSGVYLLDLINDILDMSKIEAHRYELVESIISLDETIAQSTALVRGLAHDKKITLSAAANDLRIRADARAMKQIVVNLLSNAVKFSDPGTTIQVQGWRKANGDAEICVIDQGIGMTRTEVKKALTPFGQSTDAHIRNMQGTGLGLNICLALAELHGGNMTVDSVPGKGTTVTINLPADRVVSQAL